MQKVTGFGFEYGVRTPEVVAEDWAAPRGVEESLLAQPVAGDVPKVPATRDGVDVPRRSAEPHVRSPHDSRNEPVGSSFVVV